MVAFVTTASRSAELPPVTGLPLFGLAAIAAVVCFLRARRLAVGQISWIAFGCAGLASALSHLIWVMGGDTELAAWGLIGSYAAFTVGAALSIYELDREDALDVVLDTALVLGIASVVVFRFAPAPHELVSGVGAALPPAWRATVLLSPIAAVASIFFALILLTENRRAASLGIGGAAFSFGIATVPLAMAGAECCRTGSPLVLATALGWLFLIYAALRRTHAITSDQPELASWRQRSVIAPLVAVAMAFLLIDAALRPPLLQPTAVALGMVGLLLGVRVAQLLHFSRGRSRDRRELAQSRALIEVSRALAGTTDLDRTLELVTQLACRLLRANAASLELLTPDSSTLELKAATGLPTSTIGMRFPVQGSFTGWVVQCGAGRTANDLDGEPLISPESRRILGHSPIISVPLRHRGMTLGALSCIGKDAFGSTDLELLGALADQAAIAIENARLFEQVRALSLTDPLTALANRRQLERDLTREFAAAGRGRRLVAVMFDLNAFKSYNDRHGHLAGDQVLRIFGQALTHETRAMNLAVRYGGDEFLVLLTDSTREGADVFVERVRAEFKTRAAVLIDHEILAVEAGIAEYQPDMGSAEDLIAAADRSLYDSKAARSSV